MPSRKSHAVSNASDALGAALTPNTMVLYAVIHNGAPLCLGRVVEGGIECCDPEVQIILEASHVPLICPWSRVSKVDVFQCPSDAELRDMLARGEPFSRPIRLMLNARTDQAAHDLTDAHILQFNTC